MLPNTVSYQVTNNSFLIIVKRIFSSKGNSSSLRSIQYRNKQW